MPISAGVGAIIGGIGSGVVGAAGAIGAGSEQAGAEKNAAQLQYEEQQQALQFQEQEWNAQQANEAPWLKAGGGAISTLAQLMNQGSNGPFAPWTGQFQAPTLAQAQQNPGYEFALQQGTAALQNSSAAAGGLLTGNTGEALQQYGQNLGEQNYQQVYNNTLQQYQQSYNQYQQNQNNLFNRYASLAGLGQTAAGQLGSEGQSAAGNVANISLTGGAQIGQDLTNAAAATASGYVGAANSLGGSLGSLGQYASLQSIMQALYGSGSNPGGVPNFDPNYNYMTTSGPTQS